MPLFKLHFSFERYKFASDSSVAGVCDVQAIKKKVDLGKQI